MLKIIFYILQIAVALLLPLLFVRYSLKKENNGKSSIWHGVFVYLIFNAVCNSVLYAVIMMFIPVDSVLNLNLWLSAILSGILLTVTVTVGRIIWIKYVMKKHNTPNDAVMFGSGYALALNSVAYGVSGIVSLIFSVTQYIGKSTVVPTVFETTSKTVTADSLYTIFLTALQAALVCVFEISVSVICFFAVKKLKSKRYMFYAVVFPLVAYTALEIPLSLEWRLVIFSVMTFISAGIGWNCAIKK